MLATAPGQMTNETANTLHEWAVTVATLTAVVDERARQLRDGWRDTSPGSNAFSQLSNSPTHRPSTTAPHSLQQRATAGFAG